MTTEDEARRDLILKAEESIMVLAREYSRAKNLTEITDKTLERLDRSNASISDSIKALKELSDAIGTQSARAEGSIDNALINFSRESHDVREALQKSITEAVGLLSEAYKRNEETRVNILSTLVSLERYDKDFQLFKKDWMSEIQSGKVRSEKMNETMVSSYSQLSNNISRVSGVIDAGHLETTKLIDTSSKNVHESINSLGQSIARESKLVKITLLTSGVALVVSLIVLIMNVV